MSDRKIEYDWDLDDRFEPRDNDYAADGMRLRHQEGEHSISYLLDGPSPVSSYDDVDASTTRYVQNPELVDEIVAFVVQADGKRVKGFPLTDALGSIVGIADASGHLMARTRYDVFGVRMESAGYDGIRFGFSGREEDTATDLRYHRDRYMNAATGTWLQPDRRLSPLHANHSVSHFGDQLPTDAWRLPEAIGPAVTQKAVTGHPYSYSTRPTIERDPSGFEAARCIGEDWIGAPVMYAEIGGDIVIDLALVAFGGIYSSIDTGNQLLTVSLYVEFGKFEDTDVFTTFKEFKGIKFGKAHTEIGVGGGWEWNLAPAEFEGDGLSVEEVFQVGPIVGVWEPHGGAVLITQTISFGAAFLIGHRLFSWTWEHQL